MSGSVCVHEMSVQDMFVCLWHGSPLLCTNDQTSPLLFSSFLIPLFVSATTFIHLFYYLLLSDYWPSCYMLYPELTLTIHQPLYYRHRVYSQVIHKVDFIESCYFFNIHIKAETFSHVYENWKCVGVLNTMLHLLKCIIFPTLVF